MRSPSFLRSPLCAVVLAALGMLGAVACFGDDTIWVCLNPVTGKVDETIYDDNHFVNGKADPCHCYDPCGPLATCPIVVDAGELSPDCDAGAGDGG